MVRPREVLPGVHEIPLLGAYCHLLADDRLTLIDTGLPRSRRRIARYAERLGRSLDELERIVLTHGHPDHVGGVNELATDTTQVLLHPADLPSMRTSLRELVRRPSRARFFGYVSRMPLRLAS